MTASDNKLLRSIAYGVMLLLESKSSEVARTAMAHGIQELLDER